MPIFVTPMPTTSGMTLYHTCVSFACFPPDKRNKVVFPGFCSIGTSKKRFFLQAVFPMELLRNFTDGARRYEM
jgi:hypothetical protein